MAKILAYTRFVAHEESR